MKKLFITLGLIGFLGLGACAGGAGNITASYVPPSLYEGKSCKVLAEELYFVQSKARQLTGQIEDDASGDAAATAVGLILFWPALFFIDGDDPVKRQQLADLRGRAETIHRVLLNQNCDVSYRY